MGVVVVLGYIIEYVGGDEDVVGCYVLGGGIEEVVDGGCVFCFGVGFDEY